MKQRYFRWNYFAWSGVIVFFTSLIKALIPAAETEFFRLGFPVSFLTVHVSPDFQFAVHLGLGSLIFDLFLGYLVCVLIAFLGNQFRKSSGREN